MSELDNENDLTELAALLHRVGDLWLDYAELCEQQAAELWLKLTEAKA
jgi:hypothetical protein